MLIFPRCLTFLIRSNHFRKKTCLLVDFANAYKSARGYALKKHEEQRVYRLHASWLKAYVSGLQDYDCLPQKANSLLFASCAPGRSVEEFLSTTLMQHYAREFVVDAVNRYGDKGMFHLFWFVYSSTADSQKEKGVDVKMAIEGVRSILENNVRRIVILSGDADFQPLVDFAVAKGVQVCRCQLWCPRTYFWRWTFSVSGILPLIVTVSTWRIL